VRFEYSPTAHALYLRLRPGAVDRTVEIDDLVAVDLDATGEPLGIEFVIADDLFPFLVRHGKAPEGVAVFELPDDLAMLVRDRLAVAAT
jgi:uncharacterized protein YuzE